MSFQIHLDGENQIPNLRRLQTAKNDLPQKRSVLGVINSNSSNLGLSQRTFKQAGKKVVAPKSSKPSFTVQEDQIENGARDVIKAIEEHKARLEKKDALKERKDVVIKGDNKHTGKLPASITALPQHFIPVSCAQLKAPEDDKMSECSFSYSESPMSVDKSITCKSLEKTLVTKASDAIYDLDEYRDDIFKYLLESEDRNRPKAYYMRRQPDVTYAMRTILVDWLVEVTQEYHMHTETLHIAIYIIDRFLSLMSVVRGKLQLLGTAAMFIASKYEEIYPPDVGEFVYITDETYTKKQVFRMEHLILKVLMFDISVPTCLSFIQMICISCSQNEKTKQLASFLAELTLLEGDPYFNYLPSVIASSAIAVARYCSDEKEPWSSDLSLFTGYSLDGLAPVIACLNNTHAKSKLIEQQAIQEKYKSSKLLSVSEIKPKAFIVEPSASSL